MSDTAKIRIEMTLWKKDEDSNPTICEVKDCGMPASSKAIAEEGLILGRSSVDFCKEHIKVVMSCMTSADDRKIIGEN